MGTATADPSRAANAPAKTRRRALRRGRVRTVSVLTVVPLGRQRRCGLASWVTPWPIHLAGALRAKGKSRNATLDAAARSAPRRRVVGSVRYRSGQRVLTVESFSRQPWLASSSYLARKSTDCQA